MSKLHFYAFSFTDSGTAGVTRTASVYVGYPDKLVTVPRINDAKVKAGVGPNAVLIGLGYMGRMTTAKAKGEQS